MKQIILFDIGSYDGKEFLNIAENHSNVMIYAFEPTPWAAEKIRNKTKHLPNFKLIEKAICLKNGKCLLNIAKVDQNQSNSGCNSIHNFSDTWKEDFPHAHNYYGTINKIEVETIRLDTFIEQNNIPYIDFLHVDAQGEDLNVLKSLGKYKNIVREGVIETATNKELSIYNDNPDILDCILWFKKNDFILSQITPNDLSTVTFTIEHNIRFRHKTNIPKHFNYLLIYKNNHMEPYKLILENQYRPL